MARYWVKNDDSIEGPFEHKLLKYLDGFTGETLVCPDLPGSEEIWAKANEVEALQEILGMTKIPEAPARQELPEPIPSVTAPETVPATEEQPIVEDLVTEEPIVENPAPAAESTPSDVTAVPEAEHPSEEPQPQFEKAIQQAPSTPKNRGILLVITGLAACLSLFVLWRKIPKHSQTTQQPAVPAQVRTEPAKTPAPIAETPIPAPEKKPQAALADSSKGNKPKKMKVVAKRKPAQKSAPKIVKKESPPQKEAELKTQKYILPGVPAPNINQTSPSQGSPNQEAGMKEPEKTENQEKKGNPENQQKESVETKHNQNTNDGDKNNGNNDEELNEMERMTKGFLNQ